MPVVFCQLLFFCGVYKVKNVIFQSKQLVFTHIQCIYGMEDVFDGWMILIGPIQKQRLEETSSFNLWDPVDNDRPTIECTPHILLFIRSNRKEFNHPIEFSRDFA